MNIQDKTQLTEEEKQKCQTIANSAAIGVTLATVGVIGALFAGSIYICTDKNEKQTMYEEKTLSATQHIQRPQEEPNLSSTVLKGSGYVFGVGALLFIGSVLSLICAADNKINKINGQTKWTRFKLKADTLLSQGANFSGFATACIGIIGLGGAMHHTLQTSLKNHLTVTLQQTSPNTSRYVSISKELESAIQRKDDAKQFMDRCEYTVQWGMGMSAIFIAGMGLSIVGEKMRNRVAAQRDRD